MTASLRIDGLGELLSMIERTDDEALLDAAKQGMQEGLEAAAAQARTLCPKDTGALAASIGVRISDEGKQLSGEVYAGKAYAVYVEMGTQAQPARPFLYPAFKAEQGGLVQRIGKAVSGCLGNGEVRV